MPQFVNYASNKGNTKEKKAAGAGDACHGVESENRDCETIDMTWGLDGMQYGLHVILKRCSITEGLVIDELELFDDTIFERFMYSSFGLISTTAKGVQTEESCLQAYKMLDRELTARNVPRSVMMLTGSHASRKGERVLQFCSGVGIRQHFEPSQSYDLLQALDQFNKKFHEAYSKERKRYQV